MTERVESLQSLEELVDVAASAPAALARRAGLSTSELHSLRHLMARPMGPVEIPHILGVTSAAASGVVDRLVGRGHVTRGPHPHDGRRTVVEITASGRAELMSRMAPMFAGLAEVDATLGDEEREARHPLLRGATAAMRRLG